MGFPQARRRRSPTSHSQQFPAILLAVTLGFAACVDLRLPPAVAGDSDGGASEDRLSLVGRVEAFEGQLNYILPGEVRYHPERSDLPIERLGFDLNAEDLPNVMLGLHEPDERHGVKLACHGPPCPSFGSCSNSNSDSNGGDYRNFPNVKACWNPGMEDPAPVFLPAPVNCPKVEIFERPAWPYSGRNESCSHKQDFNPRSPTALQIFRLRHVYVDPTGYLFNASHQFIRNGCARLKRLRSVLRFPPSHPVIRVRAVFNWAYGAAANFYHLLIEALPSFLVASTVLPSILKEMPILARYDQWRMYDRVGSPLIGVERGSMRALPADSDDLFFIDTVYQAQALPQDWVVVVARRLVKKRSITNFNEVEQLVERMFPTERIVMFNGSLSILEARDLFRRTRLFVAGHGAALTNVIFMPEKASVLEIRPDGCEIVCYNHLSYACSLTYHLIFSHGGCYDTVEAHISTVAATLESISRRFKEEDRKQGFDGSNK
ncbi:hypothetical protein CLOM_g4206 [Closterium sp. NIES-68]|nr:hypothetical protein CLOM_g7310 [Closterium sp. NIES-68]GJP44789.1 hypothetical protein CLOM_g4206 [Closterium sp. NIES-68]GJP62603.1 hypothetical protein CLOP_g19643 [Closterium sp. NIES-67]